MRVLLADLAAHVGERVTVAGWLHRRRALSHVTFLILRDRSGLGQIVLSADPDPLAPETVLTATGTVLASDQAPGAAQIHDPDLSIISTPADPPPLELWRPTQREQLPQLLDLA